MAIIGQNKKYNNDPTVICISIIEDKNNITEEFLESIINQTYIFKKVLLIGYDLPVNLEEKYKKETRCEVIFHRFCTKSSYIEYFSQAYHYAKRFGFFTHLDSKSTYDKDFLSILIQELQKNRDYGIAYCGYNKRGKPIIPDVPFSHRLMSVSSVFWPYVVRTDNIKNFENGGIRHLWDVNILKTLTPYKGNLISKPLLERFPDFVKENSIEQNLQISKNFLSSEVELHNSIETVNLSGEENTNNFIKNPTDIVLNRISVIIPSYNCAAYIEDCLDSLREQSYTNTEIIVINDGSTDNTKEILESYQDVVHIKHNEKNLGANPSRNIGFNLSRGELVIFCDADALYQDDYLKTLYDILEKHPDAAYSYCGFRVTGKIEKTYHTEEFDPVKLEKFNYIHTSAGLLRRKFYPGFDERIQRLQDWDFWLTLLKNGHHGVSSFGYLYTVNYRKGGISDRGQEDYDKWKQIVSYKYKTGNLPQTITLPKTTLPIKEIKKVQNNEPLKAYPNKLGIDSTDAQIEKYYSNRSVPFGSLENTRAFKILEIDKLMLNVKNIFGMDTAVDIGCGNAEYLYHLSEILPLKNLYGITISDMEIKQIKNNFPGFIISKAYAERLPYKDKEFPLLFAIDLLEHIRYVDQVVKEIARVSLNQIVTVPSVKFQEEHRDKFGHLHDFSGQGLDNLVNIFNKYGLTLLERVNTRGWHFMRLVSTNN